VSFQTIANTTPKVVASLSRISDPTTRDVIMSLLRIIQDLETTVAKVVNNNAVQGQGSVDVTFSKLAGVGTRTVVADATGKLSAP